MLATHHGHTPAMRLKGKAPRGLFLPSLVLSLRLSFIDLLPKTMVPRPALFPQLRILLNQRFSVLVLCPSP